MLKPQQTFFPSQPPAGQNIFGNDGTNPAFGGEPKLPSLQKQQSSKNLIGTLGGDGGTGGGLFQNKLTEHAGLQSPTFGAHNKNGNIFGNNTGGTGNQISLFGPQQNQNNNSVFGQGNLQNSPNNQGIAFPSFNKDQKPLFGGQTNPSPFQGFGSQPNFGQQIQTQGFDPSSQALNTQGYYSVDFLNQVQMQEKPEISDIKNLSMGNLWRFKKVKELDENGKNMFMVINQKVETNDKAISVLTEKMSELSAKGRSLEDSLSKTFIELESHHSNSYASRLKIETLNKDIGKINSYREELSRAISLFESNRCNEIHLPFLFFQDLQNEHKKIIEMLGKKIEEAEKLAHIIEQNQLGVPQFGSAFENKSLKNKIFDLCQLIYSQQMQVTSQLNFVNERIVELKERFGSTLIEKRLYHSRSDIEEMLQKEKSLHSLAFPNDWIHKNQYSVADDDSKKKNKPLSIHEEINRSLKLQGRSGQEQHLHLHKRSYFSSHHEEQYFGKRSWPSHYPESEEHSLKYFKNKEMAHFKRKREQKEMMHSEHRVMPLSFEDHQRQSYDPWDSRLLRMSGFMSNPIN